MCYQALGNDAINRQKAYRTLFENEITDNNLLEIRDAINKAWVLGDDKFKSQIETQLKHRVSPFHRGGDRKSKAYQKTVQKDQ